MDDFNRDKVDEIVLGLLQLTLHDYDLAWEGVDLEVLDRLYEKEWIENPRDKAKSLVLSEAGLAKSTDLFQHHFGVPNKTQAELPAQPV